MFTPSTPSPRPLHAGCRLVYFLPAIADVYDPAEIPTHPMLRLVANCEQVLSTRYSRRLITMEKVRSYDAAEAAAFHEAAGPPRCGLEEGGRGWTCGAFGYLISQLCLFLLSAEWRWTTCTRTSTQRDRAQTAPRRRDAPEEQASLCAVSLPCARRLLALTPPYFIPTVYTATGTLSECIVSRSARLKVFIRQTTTQSDPSTAPVARPTVSAPVSQWSAGGGLKAAARHVG